MNKKIVILGLIGYLALLVFTRFYNVDYTARFTQDESGFLVRTHQIYEEKKLTLIGQVNEQGKVFGSLSVYLLLPFAILGNFDPRAMFYGAAFWGVLTSLVLLLMSYRINRTLLIPIALMTIFWFPLLQSGRWAWNPNFVPVWIGLGIIFYLMRKNVFLFLSGICLGLAVHHHYYAIFAGGFFAFLIGIESAIKKQWLVVFSVWLGFFLTLLPFIVFDWRHPPGLFFSGASSQAQKTTLDFISFYQDSFYVIQYFTQNIVLTVLAILLSIGLITHDITKRSRALFFLAPILVHRLMLWIVAPYFFHYYLAAIPFLLAWIVYPRTRQLFYVSYSLLVIFIFSGVFTIIPLLTTSVIPDLPTQVRITQAIEKDFTDGKLKNVNIAVLGSDDHDVQAMRYRDIILTTANIRFDSHDEYFHSDHLYVVSTAHESTLRTDPAPEMHNFLNGPLVNKLPIAKSNWFVYHFAKY